MQEETRVVLKAGQRYFPMDDGELGAVRILPKNTEALYMEFTSRYNTFQLLDGSQEKVLILHSDQLD